MKEYESYAKGGDDKSLSYEDYNRFLEDNYLFFKEKKENAKLVKEQEDRKLFNLSLNQLGKNFSNNFIQMLNDMVELINKYYINKKRGTHLTLKNIVNDLMKQKYGKKLVIKKKTKKPVAKKATKKPTAKKNTAAKKKPTKK